MRMEAKVLQDEFAQGGKFQQLLLRYTQALITQISQTAVCNRLHSEPSNFMARHSLMTGRASLLLVFCCWIVDTDLRVLQLERGRAPLCPLPDLQMS